MKKIILIILISLYSMFCFSQKLIKQTDQFTGKEIKGAVVMMGKAIAPTGMMVGFANNDNKDIIYFCWPASGGASGAFNNVNPSEMSLLFKMDDGSIMRFKADTATSKVVNNVNMSMLSFGSQISQSDLKILNTHLISVFRVAVKDDNGIDLDNKYLFTDKNKEQLKKAAGYMIK